MEGAGRKQGEDSNLSSCFPSSSSSLADDIFGPKRTPSDDTVFGSIFPPSITAKEFDKKMMNQDHPRNIDKEQTSQPCHLSSSIYYGGRDVYSHPNENKDETRKSTTMKKEGEEDDTGSASRGNWWQGSLYY